MSLRGVCDAWLADITGNVTELATATQHRYAAWSFEMLGDASSGRHIAIFPEPTRSEVVPFTVGSLPSDLETNAFRGVIWEGALAEATRLVDDEAANGAWLDLYEAVKARLRVLAKTSQGTTGGYTRYHDWNAGVTGTVRFMQFGFTVQESASFT